MPATRRSARVAGSNAVTSPHSSPKAAKTGTKRKADDSPKGKSTTNKKTQTTIEEVMPVTNDASNDEEMKEATPKAEDDSTQTGAGRDGAAKDGNAEGVAPKDSEMVDAPRANVDGPAAKAGVMADAESEKAEQGRNGGAELDESKLQDQAETSANGGAELDKSKIQDQAKTSTNNDDGDQGKYKDETKTSTNGDGSVTNGDGLATDASGDGKSMAEDDNKASDQNGHGAEEQVTVNPSEDMAESKGNLIEDSSARNEKVSSNIIEKGIIYFFTRERVGVEHAEGAQDLQRTYFVMRPIPKGAKLGDGPLDDSRTNRLLALPKKVFPKSGKDRFMAFVEKGKASMSELREDFFKGGEYNTKTMGTRETHAVTPLGEGVYAITEVGRSAHLAYMLTIPREPGQVQDELGLRGKGSFVLSLKNPNNKGPANAQLPEKPEFPQEILDDFGGLAWKPVNKSEYLDYPNAQILLIGEGQDKFGSAVEASETDKKEGRDSPGKELEKLESEDEIRVDGLDAEDAVFADLHISQDEYPSVQTTW